MEKVFIAGSIGIKNLDSKVTSKINNVINSQLDIVLGDANGVDSSVQHYLSEKKVENVTVFCSGDEPRNNLGRWKIHPVSTKYAPNTRAFYKAKDLAMANSCNYGLMIWDSKSPGTLSNILELLHQNKSAWVYVNKVKDFIKVANYHDFEQLLKHMSHSALEKADKKISLKKKLDAFKLQENSLFSLAR